MNDFYVLRLMKALKLLPFTLFVAFGHLNANAQLDCESLSDKEILTILYNEMGGPANAEWDWDLDGEIVDWKWVTTLEANANQVRVINFNSKNLTGEIPEQIGCLESLEVLNLSQNQLTGNIPAAIGNLSKLLNLNLANNQLTGEIPISIGALDKLHYLRLSHNQLSGAIPPELGNLTELFVLEINNNKLTGNIPPTLGALGKLTDLNLGHNQLTGNIPAQLSGPNLETLKLNNNQLTGLIPAGLPGVKTSEIDLSRNMLTGFEGDLTDWAALEKLWVLSNKLTYEDFLENDALMAIPQYFPYPQDSIGNGGFLRLEEGKKFTIGLGVDESVTSNIYTWYKDEVPLTDLPNNGTLEIEGVGEGDAGVYWCLVTNQEVSKPRQLVSRKSTLAIKDDEDLEITGEEISCLEQLKIYRLNTSEGTFEWEISPAGLGTFQGMNGSNGLQVSIMWENPGTATVTATNTVNGDQATFTVEIVDDLDPPVLQYEAVIPKGTPIEISAEGYTGAEFKWYMAADLSDDPFIGEVYTPNVNPTLTGKVTFYATQSTGGCISDPAAAIITIVDSENVKPEQLQARPGPGKSIILEWKFGATAESFVIERADGEPSGFREVGNINPNGGEVFTYTDSGDLVGEVVYYYRVRAKFGADGPLSDFSNIVNATLNEPPLVEDVFVEGVGNDTLYFTLEDFTNSFIDPDGDELAEIQLLTFPSNGVLLLDGEELESDQVIPADMIGLLIFIPREDWSGETFFAYTASDGTEYSDDLAIVNINILPPPPRPDLIVESVTDVPEELAPGERFTWDLLVINNGDTVAGQNTLRVVLSNDNVLDGNDVTMAEVMVPALTEGQSTGLPVNIDLPQNLPSGTYYLFAIVDVNNQVKESNEDNNIVVITINVVKVEIEYPLVMNVITPNGDGFNDNLVIKNLEFFPNHRITVLNKWGQEVFTAINYQNDWAATDHSGRTLMPGAYICIVHVNEPGFEPVKEVVTVLRD